MASIRVARQNRRHPLAFVAQAGVADCINTAVYAVEAPGADTMLYRSIAKAKPAQLRQ
jgi:hypothetical protein